MDEVELMFNVLGAARFGLPPYGFAAPPRPGTLLTLTVRQHEEVEVPRKVG